MNIKMTIRIVAVKKNMHPMPQSMNKRDNNQGWQEDRREEGGLALEVQEEEDNEMLEAEEGNTQVDKIDNITGKVIEELEGVQVEVGAEVGIGEEEEVTGTLLDTITSNTDRNRR